MLDRPHHRQLAASQPRFAHTVDAFVGVYDYEQKVSFPAPHRVCLDTGYLHTCLLIPLTNDGTLEVCFKQPATRSCKLERVMDSIRNCVEMRIPRSAWFPVISVSRIPKPFLIEFITASRRVVERFSRAAYWKTHRSKNTQSPRLRF